MGDMGEVFNEMKRQKKERRASNTEKSTQLLIEKGVKFESKNSGAHLVVQGKDGRLIDFWPSTGKFRPRGDKRFQGGVFKMLRKYVEEQQ
ncbi:hypothetical protein MYE70_10430 [Marinobacter alexandrii]|uniref:hypothetical protein n=1 Tax=Marinobacter alexandrii TaxID=2570351 RepID=UPI001FFFF79B|nr:hypothetical protein [Marinobacter alexandrii]MCK2149482.1 hypothetical protein [Marinobacter alexandrii]